MAHIAARAGQGLAQLKHLVNAVHEHSSLACRYGWSALRYGREALAVEVEAATLRGEVTAIWDDLEEEFGLLVQAGLDPDTTLLDERIHEGRSSFRVLVGTEARQARHLGRSVEEGAKARGHEAQLNAAVEPWLGHSPLLRVIGADEPQAA